MENKLLLEYKGLVLFDVKGLINAYPMKSDKIRTRIVCYNFINFAFEKGLLIKTPYNSKGELNDEIIIRENDLTEKGKIIFDDLADKWLSYTDNGDEKIDRKNNIKMLEKYYNKLNV
ncbi:hypothetical protein ACYULU_14040 [Breznakiellaceae bacterium SP9]